MTTHTETLDIRPLSDAELAEANGGIAPLVVAFGCGAMVGVVVGGILGSGRTISMGELLRQNGY